ncbi:hypothetical protein IGI39_004893 [Enterococcus sp. AZ135]|uniref:hypothetical protein n=1 Tax=unclassified Enterococcus TaxID=2608891 RepID=UPI003F214283
MALYQGWKGSTISFSTRTISFSTRTISFSTRTISFSTRKVSKIHKILVCDFL